MGQSKLIKNPKSVCTKNKNTKKSSIKSLPHELLTEVIAKTASSSFTDIFNIKMASKFLNKAADDNYVLKKISVEKFPLYNKKPSIASKSFWERCKENENPEALYKQGVIDYFGEKRNIESGLMFLDQASKLGHNGACYIMGIILLLNENDVQKKQGVQIIGDLKKSGVTLKECREKFDIIKKRMWFTDQIYGQIPSICSKKNKHEKIVGFGWERDEKKIQCDACQCERELEYFCCNFREVW